MTEVSFVYITCENIEAAKRISSTVLSERLAACANIMTPHQSIYHWDGKVQEAQEVAVILKTRSDLFENLKNRVLELHSYECPCVVALPIEAGYAPFLQWIQAETKK